MPQTYWSDRNPISRRKSYPAWRGTSEADVVVIGGGLTGSIAAHVFAQAGLDVVLLEADRLARGSTEASLGMVLPQPDATFRGVEEISGRRVARTAWKATRRAAQELATALTKQRLQREAAPAPFVLNARDSVAAALLRKEQTARKAAGLDAPWLKGAAVEQDLRTESGGAIRLREGLAIDPVRVALALAARAAASGARIFERSPVRRTKFTRKYADVVLAAGRIRTTFVYVATGEPGALFSQLRRHVSRRVGFVVVTEPLPAAMRREVGRTSLVGEAGLEPRWLRWLPDDRAMFAGSSLPALKPRLRDRIVRQQAAELMYELSVRYPAISGLPAKWGWELPVVSTFDGLPWIGAHRNYPFHFFAMAFGWHGDSLAWLSARAALRAFRGESVKDDDAFGFVRHL